MIINERARKVLSQVVTLHYRTCEPVGSNLISKTRMVPFSPATIRNVMVRLESSGHLSQPHTSAGRLPTDLGYRAYVDDISLNRQPLDEFDKKELSKAIRWSPSSSHMLKRIADFTRSKTRLLTFHLPFKQSGNKLKHIHFERLNDEQLLALWVSEGGQTFEAVLDIKRHFMNQNFVEKAENYFNNAFKGCNLLEIQRSLTRAYGARPNDQWDLLMARSAVLTNALTHEASRLDSIDFNGISQLLEMPEFQNMNRLKVLFELVEKQVKIKNLVEQTLANTNNWILFFIGGEMKDPELEHLAVVLAKMVRRNQTVGCVGVMGPKRMPYLRSLQILSSAREMLAMTE